MRTRTAITAVLLALAATTAACSSSSDKPDLAACKAAMEEQDKYGNKSEQDKRPDACDGVDTKTMDQYNQEIFDDQTTK
ncbi:hypothetical protein [Streptomyces sp. AC495_CC817]|uniref:hypothetical protein n=1 Tax=Streptomyces sp. AC495_CC817 TaxID=2823900 RepID=UPI001C260FB2|nr:hypothetical protein [Streptomyces sp. AC495_CC817]